MTERLEGDASGNVADDVSTVAHGLVDDEASIEKRLAAGGRSLANAGDGQPIKNAVLLSGIELVGIETPRENLAKTDRSPESTDDYHLSGTIPPKIVEKQSPTGELCRDCNTTVSHTVAANGGIKRLVAADKISVHLGAARIWLWQLQMGPRDRSDARLGGSLNMGSRS